MKAHYGLKFLRSTGGPVDPNVYWRRTTRKRCSVCGKKIRGSKHDARH
jgi:hypothetical protein